MSNIPDYLKPFVDAVWQLCESARADPSSPIHGTPPKVLHIAEHADAIWDKKTAPIPIGPLLQAWLFDGHTFTELSPAVAHDTKEKPNGMYWPTGSILFCIDTKHRRAAYAYMLGPRYAGFFKRTFEPGQPIVLEASMKFCRGIT